MPSPRDCLARDLHLLIEKPMTLAARDARDLVQRAAAQQRVIMLGYTYHHYRCIQQARAAIAAGQIGQVQYVNSSFSSNVFQFLSGKVSAENAPYTGFACTGPARTTTGPSCWAAGRVTCS
jgi:predicted dehydrogenase